ncbi:DUF983 domain-containing protein [Asticcacaulis sp.]|uniref:DUF983 domain-containing protein n=1 Tax=Asticcacaulis sp. TaxID=1872648 RepID=UPI00262F968C|nr:DUF983 domain-containing protein [Asticcacaulis sp.]
MTDKASLSTAISRGLRRRCPACGEGHAFRGYLKVVDTCSHCQTPLGAYPCDDGPAYVTMLLVGHLVIAPMFAFEFFWNFPLEIVVPVTLTIMGALTLLMLPFIKGGFLGLIWHHGLKRFR